MTRPLSRADVQEMIDAAVGEHRALISQLQGALSGGRIVSGLVNTASGAQTGTGFRVTRNGTGDVTITFDVAFSRQLAIVAMPAESVGAIAIKGKDGVPNTTTQARLQAHGEDGPFAAVDTIFSFVAHANV